MNSIVFDLDGTLADTSADLIGAANACFEGLGHGNPLDPIKDALTAFSGGRAMLTLGAERLGLGWQQSEIDGQYKPLLDYYERDIDKHTKLYDGVIDALDTLEAQGYLLGVCTNKPEYLAEELLKRLGIRDRFLAMLGADTLPVRKPNPEHLFETIARMGGDKTKAILIGDTITDRKTAENAKLPCVLVSFGPEGDGVNRMSPEALLAHYSDLPKVAADLLG